MDCSMHCPPGRDDLTGAHAQPQEVCSVLNLLIRIQVCLAHGAAA